MYTGFDQICDAFGSESFTEISNVSRAQTLCLEGVSADENANISKDDPVSNTDVSEKLNAKSSALVHSECTARTEKHVYVSADEDTVSIITPTSKEHSFRISRNLTFQQLLIDAASYWSLPTSQVVLRDGKGGIWPHSESVMVTLAAKRNRKIKVILDIRQTSWASTFAHLEEACNSKRDQIEPFPKSLPISNASSTLYKDLWGIFTFYCVQGGDLQVDLMKAHQFTKLLQDCQLLNKVVKLEIMSIIYNGEINGKVQLNFEEFLNLISRIAKLAITKKLKCIQGCKKEEEAVYQLVVDHILPKACRWPQEEWEVSTIKIHQREVIVFFFGHLKALLAIFIFYARSYHKNPATGMREFYMSYQNFQRFINDFLFAKLQLSTVSCAQIFLAACCSCPFHVPIYHTVDKDTKVLDPESSSIKAFVATKDVEETRIATIRDLISTSGVVVAYTFPASLENRATCMGFSAFIDFLGRASLTAYTKSDTISCVKALIHHVCSEATHARVMEIIKNHGSSCVHANTFYMGTAALKSKFFKAWKEEGFPDYLAANVDVARRPERAVHRKARLLHQRAAMGKNLAISSFQYDSAVSIKASGSGREMLDRVLKSRIIAK